MGKDADVATRTRMMRTVVRAGCVAGVVAAVLLAARPAGATVPVTVPQVVPQLPTVRVVVPSNGGAGGVAVTVGPGGVQVNEPPRLNVDVPLPSAPQLPVPIPPAGLPAPAPSPPVQSVPSASPSAGSQVGAPALNAQSQTAPAATARGTTTPAPQTSLSGDTQSVTGALRPVPRDRWSTIGSAAATIGPWIALFLLAVVLRAAALSLLRDRLRENRAVS
jgi:hypothetical protein